MIVPCAYPGCPNEATLFQPGQPRSWLERVADLPAERAVGLCEYHRVYLTVNMDKYRRSGLRGRAALDICAAEDFRCLQELDKIAREGFG